MRILTDLLRPLWHLLVIYARRLMHPKIIPTMTGDIDRYMQLTQPVAPTIQVAERDDGTGLAKPPVIVNAPKEADHG